MRRVAVNVAWSGTPALFLFSGLHANMRQIVQCKRAMYLYTYTCYSTPTMAMLASARASQPIEAQQIPFPLHKDLFSSLVRWLLPPTRVTELSTFHSASQRYRTSGNHRLKLLEFQLFQSDRHHPFGPYSPTLYKPVAIELTGFNGYFMITPTFSFPSAETLRRCRVCMQARKRH